MFPLEEKLNQAWPPESWRDITVLVAVSGGADSVALLRALVRLKQQLFPTGEGRIAAAHFNHGLRGEESDRDGQFVASLCESLGTQLYLGHGDVSARAGTDGDGIEAAARDARYEFLVQTALRIGARHVVTAHTSDDQVETILHRILRGTGPSGLAGIPRVRRLDESLTAIRPLLGITRIEIEQYLADIGQDYREDASNTDTAMTRNRIRHELLPYLRENFNPNVADAMLRLGRLTSEVLEVVEPLVDQLLAAADIREETEGFSLDATSLWGRPAFLIRSALMELWSERGWPLQGMGLADWDRLAAMALVRGDAPLSPITLPGGILVRIAGNNRLELTCSTRPQDSG